MTIGNGLRGADGSAAAPPYTKGPYTTDQHYTFAGGVSFAQGSGEVRYVDGTNGSSVNQGKSWSDALDTIQAAVTAVGAKGVVYVAPIEMAAGVTDPGSYEENIVIPATHESLSIIGVSRGRTQGGLPQLKDGATTTQHILVIRAPGCLVMNLGFNGSGNTGGGILLDDDSSTKTAFGTSIVNCHFKNCKGSTATDSRTGAAIEWSAEGAAWQCLVSGCRFYKCVCDILLAGTSGSRPQDVVIEDCHFSGPAESVDCNVNLAQGSGMDGVHINRCIFPCMPALGSGSVVRALDLTGCVGILTDCHFGFPTQGSGIKTTGAAGSGAKIPTTVLMSGNYGEADTEGDTGYVFRT